LKTFLYCDSHLEGVIDWCVFVSAEWDCTPNALFATGIGPCIVDVHAPTAEDKMAFEDALKGVDYDTGGPKKNKKK
jgi:hypothetical protein